MKSTPKEIKQIHLRNKAPSYGMKGFFLFISKKDDCRKFLKDIAIIYYYCGLIESALKFEVSPEQHSTNCQIEEGETIYSLQVKGNALGNEDSS